VIEVRTQAELDAAIEAATDRHIRVLTAGLRCSVTKHRWVFECSIRWGLSVVARENSSVVARGNSSVVAWENSSVEARENSSVEARGNVFIRLFAALKIKASARVIIGKTGEAKSLEGGVIVDQPAPKTPEEWCEFYGVPVEDGVAILYKAVDAKFQSPHGGDYTPGAQPRAHDWDGGAAECGGGLHFSPSVSAALEFHRSAERFLACPIALTDMRGPRAGDQYPQKVKAAGCCAPVWEVDRKGKRVEAATEQAA
jgi:hypothetical protein